MFWIRWQFRQKLESLQMLLAWLAPHWLVRWCGVRMGAHATTGRFGDQVVPELSMMDALQRWEDPAGGDRAGRIRWGFAAAMLLLIGALVSLTSCSSAAADDRPRHKGAAPVEVRLLGDTVAATWIWKAPLRTADEGVVRFRERIGAGTWTTIGTNLRTRGTSASRVIPIPAAGDSIEVCVWVVTVGADNSPQMCQKRARSAPLPPHPGADSLEVVSVIVKPDSAKIAPDSTVQFCAGVRLSDERVILTTNSAGVESCPAMFASIPGWAPEGALVPVRDRVLGITIEAGELLVDEYPDGRRSAPYYQVRVRVADAMKYGGEWWLRRPLRVPAVG
jgi:hypothetical protein